MAKGELRFGINTYDGRCSTPWKVRVAAKRPDLYVSSKALGSLHVSLHEHPDHWHLKGSIGGQDVEVVRRWSRPSELVPGFVRALSIVVPAGVVDQPTATNRQVHWRRAPGPDVSARFDVFLEHPAANRDDSWPGRNSMKTDLVGRVSMADGWTVCVVAHDELGQSGQTQANLTFREARAHRRALLRGPMRVLKVDDLEDGTVQLFEGRIVLGPLLHSRFWWARLGWRKTRKRLSLRAVRR